MRSLHNIVLVDLGEGFYKAFTTSENYMDFKRDICTYLDNCLGERNLVSRTYWQLSKNLPHVFFSFYAVGRVRVMGSDQFHRYLEYVPYFTAIIAQYSIEMCSETNRETKNEHLTQN